MTLEALIASEEDHYATVEVKPFPKQEALLDTLATEVLFGGASEGGKSVGIRLCLITWCHLIPGLQVELYRKFYGDVIKNHMTGELNFKQLLRPWIDCGDVVVTENEVRWVHTGSLIKLGQLRTEEDAEKAQGNAKHVLVLDEATQIKSQHIADVRGWVRMSNAMKDKLPEQLGELYPQYTPEQIRDMFPRIIYSANPIGTSVGYFRRNFVLAAPEGTIFRAPDEDGGFLRQYLPSRVTDNLEADAEAQRKRLMPKGKKLARALIEGDWSAPGGDYFPEWHEERHVINPFKIPKYWFRFRTMDLGYGEPFVVLWWAVSDGQEFYDEWGNERWFPRGSLICYREWNGCDPENPEKGLRMRNQDIAKGILERTPEAMSGITLTDSLPFQDRGMGEKKKVRKIKDEFADEGVPLKKANTARIHGWSLMRDRLIGLEVAEDFFVPLIYFFERCTACREYIPALECHPTNDEDAQEKGEATHTCDGVRYACTALPKVTDAPREEQIARKLVEQNVRTVVGAQKEIKRRKRKSGKRGKW